MNISLILDYIKSTEVVVHKEDFFVFASESLRYLSMQRYYMWITGFYFFVIHLHYQ